MLRIFCRVVIRETDLSVLSFDAKTVGRFSLVVKKVSVGQPQQKLLFVIIADNEQ